MSIFFRGLPTWKQFESLFKQLCIGPQPIDLLGHIAVRFLATRTRGATDGLEKDGLGNVLILASQWSVLKENSHVENLDLQSANK